MAEAGTISEEVTTIDRSSWLDASSGITQTAPQITAPVVETQVAPVVEAPVVDVQPAPVVSTFNDEWKKEFGDLDVTTVKQKLSQFDTVVPEYEKLKTAPPVSPYKTDGGKQIDEWLSKGVKLDTIARFSSVKPEELKGEQAIKLKMEIENPQWSKEIIDAYYHSTYSYQPDELKSDEANALESNLKMGAMLKAEADAKGYLQDYLGKQFNPSGELDSTKLQREEATKQASNFWASQSGVISNAVKQVKDELRIKVIGEKGEEELKLPFSYTVPENDLKQLTDFALQSAVSGGVELTEKGVAQVNDYVQGLVWAKHGKQIVYAAVQDALTAQNNAFRKTIHNPTVAGTSATNTAGAKTAQQLAWEQKFNEQ